LDDDLLAELFAQLQSDQPAEEICRAARRKRHNERDGADRIRFGEACCGTRGQQSHCNKNASQYRCHRQLRSIGCSRQLTCCIRRPSSGIAGSGDSDFARRRMQPQSTAWFELTTGLPSWRSMSAMASIWVVLVQDRNTPSESGPSISFAIAAHCWGVT